MADKPVTVAVPEERVPEFYLWFAQFLAAGRPGAEHPSSPGWGPPSGGGPWRGGGRPGGWGPAETTPWTAEDAEASRWLYGKLAAPARGLLDLLLDEPGRRWSGNALAERLGLEKGAHGVAGLLAWPGRYCRKLGRPLPIDTARRDDGGTDYWIDGVEAELLSAARAAR